MYVSAPADPSPPRPRTLFQSYPGIAVVVVVAKKPVQKKQSGGVTTVTKVDDTPEPDAGAEAPEPLVPGGQLPELKGSIGEGPNHSNHSNHSNSFKIGIFRNFTLENSEISENFNIIFLNL